MARPGFKSWLTRVVPRPLERSTYVLASSAVLILLFLVWQPMPQMIFGFESAAARAAMIGLYLAGYGLILLLDLPDRPLRPVRAAPGVPARHGPDLHREAFRDADPVPEDPPSALRRLDRHVLGDAGLTRVGHLLFAAVMTGYILVAIPFEERDLAAQLGKPYEEWRARTPAFVPRFGRRRQPSVKIAREA